jgi:nucleoside-triphosphatase THEP1
MPLAQNSRLDRLSPAKEARCNSAQADEARRRKCTPNTRTRVLSELRGWVSRLDSPKVHWVSGMAGTGKTTIAYSLWDELERDFQLGASFFCSRLFPSCRDVTRILPSIAYQLARFSVPFQSALCNALGSNPDLENYGIDAQFDKLVREPLLAVQEAMPENVVVVIDALDECSNDSGTWSIIDALFHYIEELPIKFFLTSRPDPSINNRMLSRDDQFRSILVLHEIVRGHVQVDIETYLSSELAVMSPPPSTDKMR